MNINRPFLSIIGFIFLLVIASCGNKPSESKLIAWQPLHYFISYPSDTSNYSDPDKLKQGVWYNIDKNGHIKDTIVYKNDTAYPVSASNIREVIDMLNKR